MQRRSFKDWLFFQFLPYKFFRNLRQNTRFRRALQCILIALVVYFSFGYLHDRYGRVGIASYYSRRSHGRKTASGKRFNMYKLTAAHRRYPFGTVVKVVNLENERTVTVTINDRGPYKKGRIIDLSWEAARQLDMLKKGIAKVKIDIVSKPK